MYILLKILLVFPGAFGSVTSSFQSTDPVKGNESVEKIFIIENFEARRNKNSRWKLRWKPQKGKSGKIRGYLTVSELESTATADSRRYLDVNFRGNRQNGLKIQPPRPVIIKGFVRGLDVLIFGFGQPTELYLDITDQKRRPHRLYLGTLNFKGWKKLTLKTGRKIHQRSRMINKGQAGITFRGFYLKPHFQPYPGLTRLYIDDIKAIVRDYHRSPKLKWR